MPSKKTATPPAAGSVFQDVSFNNIGVANEHTRAAVEALAAAAKANADAIAAIARALEGGPSYGVYIAGSN